MEKFSKYFLSILFSWTLLSCEKTEFDHLTQEEQRQLSKDIWFSELSKHGFNGLFQGTPIAETLLDKILMLDPNNCDALREKSVPYLKRGIPHLWKPFFDQAVECNPVSWQPWRGYLYLYFYRDYDKAIADFNASDTLTIDFIDAPQGQSVHYWRGLAYLGKLDYQNSIKYFQTHIAAELIEGDEEWIETTTFLYLGIAQFESGQFEKAEVNLKKMLDYNYGNSADANYFLAQIKFKSGEYDKAKDFIDNSISNYEKGYYRYRDYVEEIRQIYPQELTALQKQIQDKMEK